MLKIKVKDALGVLKDYELPPGTRRNMAKTIQQRLLAETYDKIVVLSNRGLNSTKKQYIDGLKVTSNSIELNGWLPNAIEDGISGFDMKQNFARSSKRKETASGGWYLTIPFRVYTPGGNTYRNQMSWKIYRAVRAGRKYNAGSAGSRGAFSDRATGKVFEMYQHKSPILEGITQNTNKETGRSTYSTFRRVSSNSDPSSWIHTGILKHNFFDKAWAEVDLEEVINQSLSEI